MPVRGTNGIDWDEISGCCRSLMRCITLSFSCFNSRFSFCEFEGRHCEWQPPLISFLFFSFLFFSFLFFSFFFFSSLVKM